METYLDALDLWEAVEDDYEVHPLPTNPTVAQINQKQKLVFLLLFPQQSSPRLCLLNQRKMFEII
jgi:hypothetical protein